MMPRAIKPRIFYIAAYVVFSMIVPVLSEVMRMQYNVHTWVTEYLDLYAGLLPLLLLCFMVFQRSFHRTLPAFAIYVAYLCATGILQIVLHTDVFITRIGPVMAILEPVLQLILMYSILWRFCRPFPRFLALANRLFVAALVALVGVALLSVWRMQSESGFSPGVLHGPVMIGVNLVICGLIVFVLIVKRSFALPADHPLLLIAVGLGLVEAFDLIVSPIFMYYGVHHRLLLYSYEGISGGAAAMQLALWFLAVMHDKEEVAPGAYVDLDRSRKQMNDISGAFARLIYKR